MKLLYVTGNKAKIDSAKMYLEPLGIEVLNKKMLIPEIQANTCEEVAAFSAKYASNEMKCSVLKNDSGLFIDSLNGFPGVYTHYVDDTLGEDGVLKLLKGIEDRTARFIEVYAYCEYGKEPILFKSVTEGTISKEKSGTYGWSWDFIFIPKGKDKSLGNYEDEERYKLWDNKGLLDLANYLKEKTND